MTSSASSWATLIEGRERGEMPKWTGSKNRGSMKPPHFGRSCRARLCPGRTAGASPSAQWGSQRVDSTLSSRLRHRVSGSWAPGSKQPAPMMATLAGAARATHHRISPQRHAVRPTGYLALPRRGAGQHMWSDAGPFVASGASAPRSAANSPIMYRPCAACSASSTRNKPLS